MLSQRKKEGHGIKRKPLIGYYNYTVVLTYVSIISAVFGIYFAAIAEIGNAVVCLMISGVCDTFDGRVASLKQRTERERSYGVQIDSMADLIGFGALPAAILFAVSMERGALTLPIVAIAAIYVLATLIRLSYFNTVEAEAQTKKEKRTYFQGLPTTSIAILAPLAYLICNLTETSYFMVLSSILVLAAVFFVINIKIPKPSSRMQVILCLIGLPVIMFIIFGR